MSSLLLPPSLLLFPYAEPLFADTFDGASRPTLYDRMIGRPVGCAIRTFSAGATYCALEPGWNGPQMTSGRHHCDCDVMTLVPDLYRLHAAFDNYEWGAVTGGFPFNYLSPHPFTPS
ncbi:hypothetical protein C8R47DRAFT_1215604 [Mycena vitilis]|nr:hypothetical protein C8R47DRAFT_1215604 [Mycena vitilis]